MDSMVFYESFYDGIKEFPPESQFNLYNAIMKYQFEGIEPQLSGLEKGFFAVIRPQIDANIRRRENGAKGAAFGVKGGRPPKRSLESESPMGFEDCECDNLVASSQITPMGFSEETPNANVNVNVNANENANANANENVKCSSLVSYETNCQTQSVQRVVDEWNSLVDVGVTPISKLSNSSKRFKCLVARLREYGEDDVLKAVNRIRKSDFLQGKHTGKPWQITFDWFVLPNNFPKVLEGNYDNDVGNQFGGFVKTGGKVDWSVV